MKTTIAACLAAALLMAGCSSAPPPPDWKMNAVGQLEHFQARWLEGDTRAADLALAKSRAELARSGRLDLLARLELAACGTRAAALDFTACAAYAPLASEAAPADRAYARFLGGAWDGLDGGLLPPRYADLVAAREDTGANRAVAGIQDPLSRLIAAGLLLRQGRAGPETLAMAVDTASERGWRRPLLTWLEVQLRRARDAGDADAIRHLQRRIDLVEGKTRP